MNDSTPISPTALLIGTSRGIGYAMAAEFMKRGWNVVGTVRGDARIQLHDLKDAHPGQVTIEQVDLTDAGQLRPLNGRLSQGRFDILFVNARTANRRREEMIVDISTDEFVQVMLTNALGPVRSIEELDELVTDKGLIGLMSSGQGSVASNENGGPARTFTNENSWDSGSMKLLNPAHTIE